MEQTKHAGGRPTLYNPIFIDKVKEYLGTTGKEQTSLPTVEGFAIYLDVSRDSLYEWAKKYPKFSDTLKIIEIRQKQQLIDDVKLLLQNNHGMKERTDQTTNDKELPSPIYNGKSTE